MNTLVPPGSGQHNSGSRFLGLLFLGLLSACAALAQPAGSSTAGLTVHYELIVLDTSRHLVRIEVSIENAPGPSTSLTLTGEVTLDGLVAETQHGAGLAVSRQGSRYTVVNGTNRSFRLRYDLVMNQLHQRPVAGPSGFLCDTYMLTAGYWCFPVPDGVPVSRFSVRFVLPASWREIVPWTRQDDRYIETDSEVFKRSTFGAGQFELRERDIRGTLVRVAIDDNHEANFREELFDNSFRMYDLIKGAFGARGPRAHLSIFARATGPDQWQSLNESGLSQGEALNTMRDACYQFSHRVFHTYNAFHPAGMRIEPTWFVEGTNEYYDRLAMLEARAEDPLQGLAFLYHDVYLKHRQRYDAPLAGNTRDPESWERESYLAYHKGALVSLLLDREIRRLTGNRRSLDHVLTLLYAKHGYHKGGLVTDATIAEAAGRVAGADLSAFFETYIQKATFLDMEGLFSDRDYDSLSNAGEERLGTDPDRADSDGDGASDWLEYRLRTDPLSSTSKPPGTIYVDGLDQDWQGVEHEHIDDPVGDSQGGADITGIDYRREGEVLYVLFRFSRPFPRDSRLRVFMNLDTDGDGLSDRQFAAVFGQPGDTSRFRKDNTNYGLESMSLIEGLDSHVGKFAELAIPISMLGGRRQLPCFAGVWDTEKRVSLDSLSATLTVVP